MLASAISIALMTSPVTFANLIADDSDSTDFEVVVISGTKTEKQLKDVSGSISVMTQEDLEKQAITDMSQLFKYDPSIQVSGSTGNAQNIIVRGMGGDRVLMIKDGMRMNEGYGANGLNDIVGRGFIDTDTLKQVEVAKGAASSLYGSDALGGIAVFTTKDASDYLANGETFSGKVKAGYLSSGEQQNISTTLALKTGQFEHLLNAGVRDGHETQNFDETKPELDIESTSLLYKAKYNLNEQDFVAFTADIWEQEVTGNIAHGLLQHFRDLNGYTILTENSNSEKTNHAFQLRYHTEANTAVYDLLNVSIYSNDTEQKDIEYGQLDINANFGFPIIEIRDMQKTAVFKQSTQGFLSNATLTLNDMHTLGYGLDIEQSEAERTESKLYSVAGVAKNGYPQVSDKFPNTEVFRAGAFFNDEITLLDGALITTLGARFDTYKMEANTTSNVNTYREYDENHTSLNIGSLYHLTDTVAVFAQYGQGFKVPAYDLAYINHDNSLYGYKVISSDDLSPEESDTYELGIRGHINNVYFSSAVYYSQYDEFLATELTGFDTITNPYTQQASQVSIFQYQNIDSVTIKGIEAAVRYDINDELSVFTNASYQDGKNDNTDEYLSSIAPLSGATGLSFEQDALSAELIVNWAKRMHKVNDDNIEIAGYGTIDLLTSYDINDQFKLNLAITNLTDKEYVRAINGAGHTKAETLNNLTEAGRTFSANIHYRF